MRSEREIREKIEQYMEKLSYMKRHNLNVHDGHYRYEVYGIIDTLLWMLGDESGKEI